MPATRDFDAESRTAAIVTHEKIEASLGVHAAGGQIGINRQLEKLDSEWEVERVSAALAGAAVLTGFLLSEAFGRKFLVLPLLAGTTLIAQALLGRSPAETALQGHGFRTATQIAQERVTLKALRGDFVNLLPPLLPSVSLPSTGIFSPGRTRRMSPWRTSSSDTSRS